MTYNFCTSDFEGPLDLLLHLVKESKMDIYEINIRSIIDQYLEFIHSLTEKNIDVASEYLVMSSELIHLKSKLLINRQEEPTDSEDEYSFSSEEDLRNKLLEYEKYKQITKSFHELEEKRNEFFTKLPENLNEFADENKKLEGNMDIELLKNSMLELSKRMSYQKPVNTRITRKEISVEERKEFIREYITKRKNVKFTDLFEEYSKDLVVATFLSILDMCKMKEITLKQDNNFGDIFIEKVEI